MKKKVIILGASGACLDILSIINDVNSNQKNKIEFLGFLEDNQKKIPKRVKKYFLGKFNSSFSKYKDVYFVTAFGNEKNYVKTYSKDYSKDWQKAYTGVYSKIWVGPVYYGGFASGSDTVAYHKDYTGVFTVNYTKIYTKKCTNIIEIYWNLYFITLM